MWIRDNENGTVRKYGTNHHDSLVISQDGKSLSYYNLQNGDGSRGGGYSFVTDERGHTPIEDEDLMPYGEEPFANIGGFVIPERVAEVICNKYCRFPNEWDEDEQGQTMIDGVCVNCPLGGHKGA